MRIEQVNIGARQQIQSTRRRYATGIYKSAVVSRVTVTSLGLSGDTICDAKYHGGPDQAVYLYGAEDYAYWRSVFDSPFEPGTFGENLTTAGLDLRELHVGDVLAAEDLVLQVTAPRVPCNTLESRVGHKGFAKAFMQAERTGAYCRVLQSGTVAAGDDFTHEPARGDRLPLTLFLQDMHRELSESELRRYLAAPIDERNRADFERALAKL